MLYAGPLEAVRSGRVKKRISNDAIETNHNVRRRGMEVSTVCSNIAWACDTKLARWREYKRYTENVSFRSGLEIGCRQ